MTGSKEALFFSLVVPLHDEEENVEALLEELDRVLPSLGTFEVLAVDDGSEDRTLEMLLRGKEKYPWLRVLQLERCVGQSGALCAGFDAARGEYFSMMDGDRQNDPRDLEGMLGLLREGKADAVSGIRRKRRDTLVRRISSRVANKVRDWITGDRVVDSACGLKAFRREAWHGMPRFNGLHRFMPTLFKARGWRVVEIDVNHRPRSAGRPKYGVGNRALRGLIDSFGVRWLKVRTVTPRVKREY